jgi:hypothetical protein
VEGKRKEKRKNNNSKRRKIGLSARKDEKEEIT